MQQTLDPPTEFDKSSAKFQNFLLNWISDNLIPIGSMNYRYNSYNIKHWVERDTGKYVSNGQLKGAMLAAGYKVGNKHDQNWSFNISRRSPIIRKLNIL